MLNLLDPLLSPLARLMVARGVLFTDLAERLKAHYVDAAAQAGAKTDSRISVMTGLQRRDIVRLRAAPPKPQRPNHLATLVARWQTDPAYNAQPLPKSGPAPSFEALARSVRSDVHPRTMLDTLLSAETVTLQNDAVHLEQGSYQPLAGTEAQLTYLTENLGDHLAAACDNVQGHTPPHFERAVYYAGLTALQVEQLKADHKAGQMKLFQQLSNRAALMKSDQPLPSGEARHRFRAGGYFYPATDVETDPDPDPESDAPS